MCENLLHFTLVSGWCLRIEWGMGLFWTAAYGLVPTTVSTSLRNGQAMSIYVHKWPHPRCHKKHTCQEPPVSHRSRLGLELRFVAHIFEPWPGWSREIPLQSPWILNSVSSSHAWLVLMQPSGHAPKAHWDEKVTGKRSCFDLWSVLCGFPVSKDNLHRQVQLRSQAIAKLATCTLW